MTVVPGSRTNTASDLRGILLMILGAGVLLLNDATAKWLTESYPVWQVLGLRQIAATVPIVLYVHYGSGWHAIRPRDPFGQAARGVCFVATVWLMVLSLSLLPLPTVTAIAFASPVIVAALSVPILGEHVGWRRWCAIICGFAGVLVIVQPGGAAFESALLVPVGAALGAGLRDLVTRRAGRYDSSLTTLFWSSVLVIASSLPTLAIDGWRPVAPQDAGLFALAGLFNTSAHFLMIEALRLGRAVLVAPFRYSALLWSVVIGFVIWQDKPNSATVLGAAIIVASGVYMTVRGKRGHQPERL